MTSKILAFGFSFRNGTPRYQVRAVVRAFSNKRGPNLPTHETSKTLSSRDKQFHGRVQKLRSAMDQEPPVVSEGFYPTATTNQGVYMGTTFLEYPPQPLPQLFATALLDPKTYCKQSASSTSTISGSDAARRLLRGKRNFWETMRHELVSKNNREVQKMYLLQGHGVPVQLWRHLLDAAYTWLHHRDHVQELSVQNLFGANQFDMMLIHTEDGASLISPWPTAWQPDMDLYMAVVIRMSNLLSIALQKDGGSTRLKKWNVTIQRGNALPPQLLSLQQSTQEEQEAGAVLTPVVEFSPTEVSTGRILIRLQGTPKTEMNRERQAVAMIFEATYDTSQEVGPSNFMW